MLVTTTCASYHILDFFELHLKGLSSSDIKSPLIHLLLPHSLSVSGVLTITSLSFEFHFIQFYQTQEKQTFRIVPSGSLYFSKPHKCFASCFFPLFAIQIHLTLPDRVSRSKAMNKS